MLRLSRKRGIIATLFLAAALIVFIAVIVFWGKNNEKQAEETPELYRLEKSEDLSLTGKVAAKQQQQVTYNASFGEITQINVTNGQSVKSGEVLATYSSSSNQYALKEKQALKNHYTVNITNLESNLTVAKERLRRAKANEDEGEKQAAESEISTAKSSLITYRDQLTDVNAQIETLQGTSQTVVVADFDGTVFVDAAKQADSTVPVIVLYSNDLVIKSVITEYDREKLEKDQKAKIQYGRKSSYSDGTISSIGNIPENGDSSVSSYSVEVTPKKAIPLGYSVEISISQSEMYLPKTAVKKVEDQYFVQLFSNGDCQKTKIDAVEDGSVYKVVSGLSHGDKVVKNYDDIEETSNGSKKKEKTEVSRNDSAG